MRQTTRQIRFGNQTSLNDARTKHADLDDASSFTQCAFFMLDISVDSLVRHSALVVSEKCVNDWRWSASQQDVCKQGWLRCYLWRSNDNWLLLSRPMHPKLLSSSDKQAKGNQSRQSSSSIFWQLKIARTQLKILLNPVLALRRTLKNALPQDRSGILFLLILQGWQTPQAWQTASRPRR